MEYIKNIYHDISYQTTPEKVLQAFYLNDYLTSYFIHKLEYQFPDENLNSSTLHIDKALELLYSDIIDNENDNLKDFKFKNDIEPLIHCHLNNCRTIEDFFVNTIDYENIDNSCAGNKSVITKLLDLLQYEIETIIPTSVLVQYKEDNSQIIKHMSKKSFAKLNNYNNLFNNLTKDNDDIDYLIKSYIYKNVFYPVLNSMKHTQSKIKAWEFYRYADLDDQFYRLRKVKR